MSNSPDKYPDPQNCPHCGYSLKGEAHPEGVGDYYGDTTHFNVALGCVVRGVYDGILYWVCPFCDRAWARDFGAALTLQRTSERHAEDYNAARRLEASRQ